MPSALRFVLLASLLAGTVRSAAAETPHLLCYGARPASRGSAATPIALCRPAAVTDEPVTDGGLLVGWTGTTATAGPTTVDVVDPLGRTRFRLRKSARLLIAPGSDDAAAVCRGVEAKPNAGQRGTRLALTDAHGEHVVRLRRPHRLCTPAGAAVPHLVCYGAKETRSAPAPDPATVEIDAPGGRTVVRVGRLREVCVPTLVDDVPPVIVGSTPPEPAPVTLTIFPQALTVEPGSAPAFAATALLPSGGSQDWSSRVQWRSSDHTIARPTRTTFDTLRRGTVTVSAFDPVTGLTSGNATLTVVWPLERLTIAPFGVYLKPGDVESFTVTGHFAGGVTRNLTQRVVYLSTAPKIVAAPNAPGRRSRVEALAPGLAGIRARDPISGIYSDDFAVVRVAGPVRYISVEYSGGHHVFLGLLPGETRSLTAIGHYPDGSERNLTQTCTWSSADPAIAATPMPEHDRSRIAAVAPGTTRVTCRDPDSGVEGAVDVDVLGDLVGVEIGNAMWPPIYARHPRDLTGRGVYAGFENTDWRGRRVLTQELVWTSRDPDVAIATNSDGDRSRIEPVGSGMARIYATDPVTGISSDDFAIPVYGEVTAMTLTSRGEQRRPYAIGTTLRLDRLFRARGTFEIGMSLPLERFAPEEIVYESSAPDVFAILPDGVSMRALSQGTATITVRHVPTGLVSNGLERSVEGDLEQVRLEPATIRRGIGETETLTAFAVHPPGNEYLVTQELTYTSSDPSVVVATNDADNRSLLRTVGGGTAIITATHPPTGVTATMTVEVLPGTLSRITITPPTSTVGVGLARELTAIGHYPDGRTLNVTQQMTWSSTAPAVAQTPSQGGGRSQVRGLAPGTATIVARHPSGLASTDTGDDATVIVQAITSVSLTPAVRTASAGSTIRYTLTGRLADGTPVNLTQHAYYFTDDGRVALTANEDGDRSAIELVGPGTVTVMAQLYSPWKSHVASATLHVTD